MNPAGRSEYYDGSRSIRAVLEVGCGQGSFAAKSKRRTGTETRDVELDSEAGAEVQLKIRRKGSA